MRLLVEQRQAWRQGKRVLVETYLERHPRLADDDEAVLDLIDNEVLARREQGEAPRLDEYLRRFPRWAAEVRLQFEVEQAIEADRQAAATLPAGLPRPTLPARPPSAPGPLSIPGYEVLGVLGRGAMGVVYRARQVGLDRLVALKTILAGEAAGPEERSRFRQEAEAVARLHHPNIVQIYDLGEHDGQPYFALEHVAGGTLAERLAGRPQPPREAARLTEALAIHHAHEKGIVHRDLKPSNVLLQRTNDERTDDQDLGTGSSFGTPKITDFGLVKRLHGGADLTQTGHIVGTLGYMAPEQAAGRSKEVGPAADVYALGAILYECLTGRAVFQGDGDLEVLQQIVNAEPAPPSRLRPELPRDLEVICLHCLRKQPNQRYASALALAEDLRRFQAGRPVLARPPGRAVRLWRRLRRSPVLAGGLALALAALLLVVAVLLSWGPRPGDRHAADEPGDRALIFEDDFGGHGPVAEPVFPGQIMFVRTGGAAHLTSTEAGVLPVLFPEHPVQDFVAEFEVRFPADLPAGRAGLLFRARRNSEKNGLPFYNYLALDPNSGRAVLGRFDFEAPRQFMPLAAVDWTADRDRDVPVRLEVVGRRFRVFVDGALLVEAEDARSPEPGLLALCLYGAPDRHLTTVVFRKLRVSRPEP
jgi:hypothetical protein